MTRSVFFFECSTDEAFSYVLEFSGLVLTGRTFQVLVKDRTTSTVRATLTLGDGLTLASASVISAAVAKGAMTAWPRGEYSADLRDITDGGDSRIMAVRFSYDLPGNLVNGVGNRKAFVTWSNNTALVTATGAVGPSGPPGPQGWSPALAVVSDGARRVLRVVDWVGGLGTKPAAGAYVGATGLVTLIADAIDVRGAQGAQGLQGDQGLQGIQGIQGQKGWSPQFALVADGARRVLRVTGWTGGAGTAPATGDYVGASGLVSAIGDAIDLRGPEGSAIAPGSVDTTDLVDGILSADATGRAKMADRFNTFPKLPAIASARALGRKSAGSGDIEELAGPELRALAGMPFGYYSRLTLSNNVSNPNTHIDIAAGVARGDADTVDLILAAGLTKRMDAAWAVGTGNGGWLDGSSMPDGTGHLFLMRRSDTGAVEVGGSASATAPTLPSGYDAKRRVGAILRVSGAILPFIQIANEFHLTPSQLSVSAAAMSTTAALATLTVPNGIVVKARVGIRNNGGTSNRIWASSPLLPSEAISGTNALSLNSGSSGTQSLVDIWTNTSRQIRVIGDAAIGSYDIRTYGWTDDL